jgi:hypothetical protein
MQEEGFRMLTQTERKTFMSVIGKYLVKKGLANDYYVSLAKGSLSMYLYLHIPDGRGFKIRVADHKQVYDADLFVIVLNLADMTKDTQTPVLKFILKEVPGQLKKWLDGKPFRSIFQYGYVPQIPKTITLYLQEQKSSPEVELVIPTNRFKETALDLIKEKPNWILTKAFNDLGRAHRFKGQIRQNVQNIMTGLEELTHVVYFDVPGF